MKCFTHGASTWEEKGRKSELRVAARLRGQWEGHEGSDMGASLSSVFPVLGRWDVRSQVGRSFLLTCVSPNHRHLLPKILFLLSTLCL